MRIFYDWYVGDNNSVWEDIPGVPKKLIGYFVTREQAMEIIVMRNKFMAIESMVYDGIVG